MNSKTEISQRLYTSVTGSGGAQTLEYTVANNKTLYIKTVGGNAPQSNETTVLIIWDEGGSQEKKILTTCGDADQESNESFVGDGNRKLKIKLTNNTLVSHNMGGFFLGYLIEEIEDYVPPPIDPTGWIHN